MYMTVKAKDGDYWDAIKNRKAILTLLVHEIFGGLSPTAARHLRYLARKAAELDHDLTDYSRSYTARSFVPYYAQQISSAIVMIGAQGILKRITKMRGKSLLRASDEEGDGACAAPRRGG